MNFNPTIYHHWFYSENIKNPHTVLFSWCGMLRFYVVSAVVLYLGWPYAIWNKFALSFCSLELPEKVLYASCIVSHRSSQNRYVFHGYSWLYSWVFCSSLVWEWGDMLCWAFYLCLFCSVLFFFASPLPFQFPQSRRKELTYIFTVYQCSLQVTRVC